VKLAFHIVDVFTDRPLTGNQLAVVLDADPLSEPQMQAIAREFGFSETTFVLRPDERGTDCRVRIFTPSRELPMAGHPVVGTTLVLQRAGRIGDDAVLGLGVGPTPVEIDRAGLAWMTQPKARFGPIVANRAALAAALGLEESDLRSDLPLRPVSTGNEFLMVPVVSLEAMRRLAPDAGSLPAVMPSTPHPAVYCFCFETEQPGVDVHCRMFAPSFGIFEDPATGSAAGPLGVYLWSHVHGEQSEWLQLVLEQGVEMGRPSLIRVRVPPDGSGPRVGGAAAFVASGELDLT
jgi:trans-2,3-dihydro-3-hydroxyanthranilate isomerase